MGALELSARRKVVAIAKTIPTSTSVTYAGLAVAEAIS